MREDEARKYFQQLINAVDYCHSRGVYHRDLKVLSIFQASNHLLVIHFSGFFGIEWSLIFFPFFPLFVSWCSRKICYWILLETSKFLILD